VSLMVRVASELVADVLTSGHKVRAMRVEAGLPAGCVLESAVVERGDLLLYFKDPNRETRVVMTLLSEAEMIAQRFVELNPGRFPDGLDVSSLPVEEGIPVIPLPPTAEEAALEARLSAGSVSLLPPLRRSIDRTPPPTSRPGKESR